VASGSILTWATIHQGTMQRNMLLHQRPHSWQRQSPNEVRPQLLFLVLVALAYTPIICATPSEACRDA
jgi:hypothetical protein